MKNTGLLILFTVFSCSLAGQDTRLRERLEAWTYPALNAIISQACDSMQSQQKIRLATIQLAKPLLGDNSGGRLVFGKCEDNYFRTVCSPDTAQLLVAASRENKRARTLINRWSFVLARGNALKSKSGTQELYRKYGDKLLKMLENPDKREELINREVLIYTMFFNEWVDRPYDFGSIYCGQVENESVGKLAEEKGLSVRGTAQNQEVSAGGSLDPENVLFSYPGNGQVNFQPLEFIREYGVIKLKGYCCEGLREASRNNKLWLKWTSSKGQTLFTRAVLREDEVAYQTPSYYLDPGEFYRMELVAADTDIFDDFLSFYGKRELLTLVEKGIYHLEKKPLELGEVFFTAYFRVSRYPTALAKDRGTEFYPSPGEKEVYLMAVKEEFGADEISGDNGLQGTLRLNLRADRSLDKTLDQMYGRNTGLYLNHPSQEYVDYLAKYRDSLNVDSLIAIEFMPLGERTKKYRRLRYTDGSGKKTGPYSFGSWLSAEKPEFRKSYTVQANTRRVTKEHFENPTSFQPTGDTIRVEINFTERVGQVYAEFVPIVAARHAEYAGLLRQLNELASRPVASGTDYRKIVADINPNYLTNPESLNIDPAPREAGKFIDYSYGLPMGAITTTHGYIPLGVNK